MSLEHRLNIINNLKFVDEEFVEESLELKNDHVKKYSADILAMGEDWKGDSFASGRWTCSDTASG